MTWVDDGNAALLTDLYELTMAASYHAHGMDQEATFDLFVRKLPANRNFLVVCGIDDALSYLENVRFDRESLDHLGTLELFDDRFLEYLEGFRFSGEVCAIPEGEVAFAQEPLMRVTGPLIEAQIVETFLINTVTFQTMVASKAARCALAAADRPFVDFSPRRDHGADAALKAARAAYIGGASGTSNVLAGKEYGIPLSGTMAHSYVMAFESELEAFRAFARDFGDNAVLLIDTFDVEEGARRAARVAAEMAESGVRLRGVRIDSGDLGALSERVRKILDEAGFEDMQIFLSGDLDEYRIAELLKGGAPVDAFGVGTQLGTSGDAPSLGGVYKLVAEGGAPKIKLSAEKITLPGVKQVYRIGRPAYIKDVIALADESIPDGRPLLITMMENGRRSSPSESLEGARDRCGAALRSLPERLTSLKGSDEPYEIELSPELRDTVERMMRVTY